MDSIKQKLLKFRTKRSKNSTKHRTLNYADAKYVGVLFKITDEDKHDYINNFVHSLEKDGKRVEALTFFDRDHNNPYDFKYEFFTQKDISLLGEIKSESVHEFAKKEFDYLFCISRESMDVFDYILTNSRAKCRLGKHEEGKEKRYEIMLQHKEFDSIDKLIAHLMGFVKKIVNN
ncbi:MAG: hypothetical protein ACI81T_000745 [Bacteroidia bacterium]|jgi:hypothetical protein